MRPRPALAHLPMFQSLSLTFVPSSATSVTAMLLHSRGGLWWTPDKPAGALPPRCRRILALGSKRHEGDIAGPFDGYAKLALVAGAIPRDPAWNDFASLSDQIAQTLDVFVVDVGDLIGTEATDFFAWETLFS